MCERVAEAPLIRESDDCGDMLESDVSILLQRYVGDSAGLRLSGIDADGPNMCLRMVLMPAKRSESAGEGLGVDTVAVELGVSPCCNGGVWQWAVLMRSAARRTLVGTLFSRIAPPGDAVCDDERSVPENDCPNGTSDHGEGSGFNGDTIDAEEDNVGRADVTRRPVVGEGGGSLRKSIDVGRRNSDVRRWRGALRSDEALLG
jgi:hypothetical protein